MVEIYTHIIKIITDSTQRWTKRSAAVIVILFILWFVNNTFDFINSFRANNRLQQLETIGQLLNDTTLTKEEKGLLITERQRIFKHRTVIDNVQSFVDSLPNPISLIRRSTAQKPDTTTTTSKNSLNKDDSVPIPTKSYWLTFISSNAFVLLIFILIPFSISYKKNTFNWVNIVALLFIYGVIFLICAFIAYLFYLIPLITENLGFNYALYFFIQFGFWAFISYLFQKLLRKK